MKYTVLNISVPKIFALVKFWQQAGEHYGLGSKVGLDSFEDSDGAVDCSGLHRHLVYKATKVMGNPVTIPDGSFNQGDWYRDQGFKTSTPGSCKLHDNVLRVAILRPSKSKSKIGHISFFYNGMSAESHGGSGPDTRSVAACWKWLQHCEVYCVTLPPTIAQEVLNP